jgi:hypothetical protein
VFLPPDSDGNVSVMPFKEWDQKITEASKRFDGASDDQRKHLFQKAKADSEWSLWQTYQSIGRWGSKAFNDFTSGKVSATEEEKKQHALDQRLIDARQELGRLGAHSLVEEKVSEERTLAKLSRPNDDTVLLNSADNLTRTGMIVGAVSGETAAVLKFCAADPTSVRCHAAMGLLAGTAFESARQVARVQYDHTQDVIDGEAIAVSGGVGAGLGIAIGQGIKYLPALLAKGGVGAPLATTITKMGVGTLGVATAGFSGKRAIGNAVEGKWGEAAVEGTAALSSLGFIVPGFRGVRAPKGAAAPPVNPAPMAAEESIAVAESTASVPSASPRFDPAQSPQGPHVPEQGSAVPVMAKVPSAPAGRAASSPRLTKSELFRTIAEIGGPEEAAQRPFDVLAVNLEKFNSASKRNPVGVMNSIGRKADWLRQLCHQQIKVQRKSVSAEKLRQMEKEMDEAIKAAAKALQERVRNEMRTVPSKANDDLADPNLLPGASRQLRAQEVVTDEDLGDPLELNQPPPSRLIR